MTDIECMARSICKSLGCDPEQINGVRELWTFYQGHATDAKAALAEAGLVIRPLSPDAKMREAGDEAMYKPAVHASQVYRAMNAAYTGGADRGE